MLNTHTLTPKPGSRMKSFDVGRGTSSGLGKTAGRGYKGQRARSGGRHKLAFKGSKALIQSLPKLRGFKSMSGKPVTVTVSQLQKEFADGTVITAEALRTAGFVRGHANHTVKIVGNTKVEKKFTLQGVAVTAGARTAIEAAGGTVTA